MAKPLSGQTRIIREAINANPGKKAKEIARIINDSEARKEDKIKVTTTEVSIQRRALKKLGGSKSTKTAKPAAPKAEPASTPPLAKDAKPTKAKGAGPADLIDRLFDMADEVGGFDQLKRMVDRIANSK